MSVRLYIPRNRQGNTDSWKIRGIWCRFVRSVRANPQFRRKSASIRQKTACGIFPAVPPETPTDRETILECAHSRSQPCSGKKWRNQAPLNGQIPAPNKPTYRSGSRDEGKINILLYLVAESDNPPPGGLSCGDLTDRLPCHDGPPVRLWRLSAPDCHSKRLFWALRCPPPCPAILRFHQNHFNLGRKRASGASEPLSLCYHSVDARRAFKEL